LFDVGEQAATGFFKRPSTGEEENAESDEAERAAEFVEHIAEVEPGDADAEGNDAEVDEAAAGLANSPPDEEDAEACYEGVSDEVGFSASVSAIVVAVMVVLGPDALAPGQGDDEGDGGEHGNR